MPRKDPRKNLQYRRIDPIHGRTVTIQTGDGPKEVKGITVRALRAALADMDQDSLVCYMAEMDKQVLVGCIAGAVQTESEVVALVGPEVTRGLKALGATPEEKG